jgi:NACHT domain
VVAVVLFLLPAVVALVLVRRHHPLDTATVGVLVAMGLGLPVIWLTWALYRDARRSAARDTGLSLADVADQLAIAVGAQWEAEAAVRRLNDPYPLPVSWDPADPSLTDSWDSLVKLASTGAGWPSPLPEGTWAAGPADLAGAGNDLAKVLARVPTGRLVVLGEAGAGKTMLMVRLVLDLLARRADGGPVPVLASVASWNPEEHELRRWLSAELVLDHPGLAAAPPAGRGEPTQAAALLASGLILPILDGLDEIPEEVRGPAVTRINDTLRAGELLVVTCRSEQYLEAVKPKGGIGVTLRAAAAIQLHPLDASTVRDYLCDDAVGPVAKARWDPVLNVLGTDAPAGQALSTPLMVSMARAIYNPRPGELAGTLRDPAELCSPWLVSRASVESMLFDAFIPAAYRHAFSDRRKMEEREEWLALLARVVEYDTPGTDLAWWQVPLALPDFVPGVVAGAVAGVATGAAAGAVAGLLAGAGAGTLTGAAIAFVVMAVTAMESLTRQWRGLVYAHSGLADAHRRIFDAAVGERQGRGWL